SNRRQSPRRSSTDVHRRPRQELRRQSQSTSPLHEILHGNDLQDLRTPRMTHPVPIPVPVPASMPVPVPEPNAEIGYFTLDGVQNARIVVVPFQSGDGLGLTLTRFTRAPCDDVVLLIHGLTSSSDMFIMPEHQNLVTTLLDSGFADVWCLDG